MLTEFLAPLLAVQFLMFCMFQDRVTSLILFTLSIQFLMTVLAVLFGSLLEVKDYLLGNNTPPLPESVYIYWCCLLLFVFIACWDCVLSSSLHFSDPIVNWIQLNDVIHVWPFGSLRICLVSASASGVSVLVTTCYPRLPVCLCLSLLCALWWWVPVNFQQWLWAFDTPLSRYYGLRVFYISRRWNYHLKMAECRENKLHIKVCASWYFTEIILSLLFCLMLGNSCWNGFWWTTGWLLAPWSPI